MIPFTKLNSTNRKNLRDIIPLEKPFTILIEPSSLCNFKCIHCFQSLSSKNYFTEAKGNMDLALYSRIIEQLQAWPGEKLKVLKLSLYGEPLLNPDFCKMLEIARNADIAERIETTTNASLLTEEVAECLVRNQLDYLRVSIYATDQEAFEKVTGSHVDMSSIADNLAMLKRIKGKSGSLKPFVAPKMLDSYDDKVNSAFMAIYRDVADELFLDKPHSWIRTKERDLLESHYKDKVEIVKEDLAKRDTKQKACPMAFTTMAIRSNGDVSPCCVDYLGGTNITTIMDKNIRNIWSSPAWRNFQRMQLEFRNTENPSCANCDFFHNCHYMKDNIDGLDFEDCF